MQCICLRFPKSYLHSHSYSFSARLVIWLALDTKVAFPKVPEISWIQFQTHSSVYTFYFLDIDSTNLSKYKKQKKILIYTWINFLTIYPRNVDFIMLGKGTRLLRAESSGPSLSLRRPFPSLTADEIDVSVHLWPMSTTPVCHSRPVETSANFSGIFLSCYGRFATLLINYSWPKI